jgi:hypothetical protein
LVLGQRPELLVASSCVVVELLSADWALDLKLTGPCSEEEEVKEFHRQANDGDLYQYLEEQVVARMDQK